MLVATITILYFVLVAFTGGFAYVVLDSIALGVLSGFFWPIFVTAMAIAVAGVWLSGRGMWAANRVGF